MVAGFEDAPPPKQEIVSTRSFGRVVTQLPDLVEAVSEFASRAAEKLRRGESLAGQVLVFVHTSPFRRDDRQYSRAARIPLRRPAADTGEIVTAAVAGLERIHRPNYNFVKAGVHLLVLQSRGIEHGDARIRRGLPGPGPAHDGHGPDQPALGTRDAAERVRRAGAGSAGVDPAAGSAHAVRQDAVE
jgi:DNA polymerase V